MGKLLLMISPVFNKCRQAMFNFQCWTDPSYFQNKVMKSESNFSVCYTVSLVSEQCALFYNTLKQETVLFLQQQYWIHIPSVGLTPFVNSCFYTVFLSPS